MISKIFLATCLVGFVFACAAAPPRLFLKDRDRYVEVGQIISGATGAPVTFDEMLADLAGCRVVYVGEIHTDPAHHAIQLKILKALANVNPRVAVGMEMVDFTYQVVLDQWSAAVRRWSEMNEKHRRNVLPDRNAEYLFYQTAVGAWPLPVDRALAYAEKASREAMQHTTWTERNIEYDEALPNFVTQSTN